MFLKPHNILNRQFEYVKALDNVNLNIQSPRPIIFHQNKISIVNERILSETDI